MIGWGGGEGGGGGGGGLVHDLLQQSQKLCVCARWVYMWVLVWMFCMLKPQEHDNWCGEWLVTCSNNRRSCVSVPGGCACSGCIVHGRFGFAACCHQQSAVEATIA